VVVSVIALLIGILLPALSMTKAKARDAVCLSNHRQIATAFGLYFIDYDNFPVAGYPPDGIQSVLRQRFSWGGVYWYEGEDDSPSHNWLRKRPMNKYLQAKGEQTVRAEIFECPSDDSMRYSSSDERVIWEHVGAETNAEEGAVSVFATVGTSYFVNDWCYVDPWSWWGVGDNHVYFRSDLGPDDVLVNPSHFVLVCDAGQWTARYGAAKRKEFNIIYGWWHGYERGNMMFLDGSARPEEMGEVVTPTYSFYLNPKEQGKYGFRFAFGGN
jgi:hypothetical protein